MNIVLEPVPPPRGLPTVILKLKEAYLFWLTLQRNLPKVERLGLGQKIDQAFLDTIELTYIAAYLPPPEKILMLARAKAKLDRVKFFAQFAWEARLIHTEQYSELTLKLEEIGRQLGGWKRGLETKTPQP